MDAKGDATNTDTKDTERILWERTSQSNWRCEPFVPPNGRCEGKELILEDCVTVHIGCFLFSMFYGVRLKGTSAILQKGRESHIKANYNLRYLPGFLKHYSRVYKSSLTDLQSSACQCGIRIRTTHFAFFLRGGTVDGVTEKGCCRIWRMKTTKEGSASKFPSL